MVSKPKFKFIGGTLCLDFVNTVGGRVGSERKGDFSYRVLSDKLTGFDDLVRWSESAGVLSRAEALKVARRAASQPSDAKSLFDRAIVVRESLYRVCKSLLAASTPPAADVVVLNRELANARSRKRLKFSEGGFVWSWDKPDALDRILWTVIDLAGEFLASSALASLRQCPGDDCGWLFLDESRNGSRQWCEMRICGNRAKLRRFRERLQGHRSVAQRH